MKYPSLALLLAVSLAAAGQQSSSSARKIIHLPSSKLLFEPVPGSPVPTNSFPGTMAPSPDRRYVAIVNNGRGVDESKFQQSIGIYDTQTAHLTDFPDERFKLNAAQTLYYGAAFSSSGRELYVSVGSLTDPEGKKPGDLGNGIAVYAFHEGQLSPSRFIKIPMQKIAAGHHKTEICKHCEPGETPSFPAGLALVPGRDGQGDRLVIAGNLADNVLLMDPATGAIEKTWDVSVNSEIPAVFPYRVRVDAEGEHAYVTLWNTDKVVDIDLKTQAIARTISLAEEHPQAGTSSAHPASMAIYGPHLFVALANRDQVVVVDRASGMIECRISTRLPGMRYGGAYPTSLSLSKNGKTLYVANSGTDSVLVFTLLWSAQREHSRFVKATLRGAIPTEWYPVSILLDRDELLIATAKSRGTGPNNEKPRSGDARKTFRYIGGMVYGSLVHVNLNELHAALPTLTKEVDRANLVTTPAAKHVAFRGLGGHRWPIKHVLYIIKENRTYDQLFGDLGTGNGDPSLTFYGWDVTPNQHRLAQQFGVLDNFYTSGEISGNGHVWSTAAITSDYTERTWQINYRGGERTYDFEGVVGNENTLKQGIPDLDEPGTGFLWALAKRSGITYRDYGEYIDTVWCVPAGDWQISPANASIRNAKCKTNVVRKGDAAPDNVTQEPSPYPWDVPVPAEAHATKPELVDHFDPFFPAFRLEYPDQWRADEFLREFNGFVDARKHGDLKHELPQLMIMHLPNDHTSGTRAGVATPQAAVADNDLALGRIVEAISRSPYWNDTAILVLEDDAQDGPDHVDAHRSPALVISKYSPAARDAKPYVESGFFTTVNMVRTMEELLHLPPMNHNDALAAPLAAMFDGKGNQPAYKADDRNLQNGLIYKANPLKAPGSQTSERMDFSAPDQANAAALNAVLWRNAKGDAPMPPPRHTVIPEQLSGGDRD